MRMLVSGSGGLIGRALVARLEADGHLVHRVIRDGAIPGAAAFDLATRRLDLSGLPGGSLDRIDAVFHLSGEPLTPRRWSEAKRERVRASRVVTTDLLARAIAAADTPPAVFVSASAVGYYGSRGDELLDETSTPGSGFLADLCRAWEAAAAPARDAGIRVVNIRTGIVLSRANLLIGLQLPLFRAGLGAHLGSGRQWMSWIALDDTVGAIIHAALTPAVDGPCNLTAPHPARNAEFTEAFARAVHRRSRLGVPGFVLEAAMGREVVEDVILASQRALPRRLTETGFDFSFSCLDDAFAAALAKRPGTFQVPGDPKS
ncbi:MAG TPA: TIGR01777 family oxidoreductase [Acidimicrobiales bacterium]|nr:TIGR01777 family oxidoreductase [Acidimicrobiales bacterium]